MDVVVRGRHCEVSDRMRAYVTDKLAKLERYDSRPLRIDVEIVQQLSSRRPDGTERVELTAHSRGPVVRVEASAEERHAAFDLAYQKLEAKLRKAADRRRVHYGMRRPTGLAEAPLADAPLGDAVFAGTTANGAANGAGEDAAIDDEASAATNGAEVDLDDGAGGMVVDGDGPMVVRRKTHLARPMPLEQALYEMELVGHDFYLFVEEATGTPSVVYRRRAYDYGVIQLQLGDDVTDEVGRSGAYDAHDAAEV